MKRSYPTIKPRKKVRVLEKRIEVLKVHLFEFPIDKGVRDSLRVLVTTILKAGVVSGRFQEKKSSE